MQCPLHMDSNLYRAAISGNIIVLSETKGKLSQLTPSKCTVLHLASHSGKAECVQEIIKLLPSLLLEQNSNGETPLHLAAKQGHLHVVKALLDGAKTLPEDRYSELRGPVRVRFMRERNLVNGYTALHEAVRYNRLEVVKVLVEEDTLITNVSDSFLGSTPLYVAACRGYLDLVIAICQTYAAPGYGGPHDTTALHGAVINGREECVAFLLRWKISMIAKEDEYGRTAFHYAAYHQSPQMMKHLLEANKSFAYVQDKRNKRTALHIAANQGNMNVVKELVEFCPDCCEMVDSRGRNVLHIAVELRNKEMIEYLLQNIPIMISILLDQKDEDGNTPLDLLAMSGFLVPEIIQHNMADKEELNKKRLSPVDLFYCNDKLLAEQIDARKTLEGTWNSRRAIREDEELDMKTYHTEQARRNAIEQKKKEYEEEKVERIRKLCDTHIIVATLMATVCFTAGFTMPGGFDQDKGPNQGLAILTKNTAFKAFIVTDTLGLLFSTASLVIYFVAAIYNKEEDIASYIRKAVHFNIVAIVAMMLAFITGTYAVLPHSSALAIALLFIGCSFFVLFVYMLKKVIRDWLLFLFCCLVCGKRIPLYS